MIITIKMKDAAATAMARKVFKPQMDQYMETARETILAGFEHLHGPASRRARDSGVEFAYLTTRKRLSLSTVVTKTGNAYPQSMSVAWVTNAFFSINDYPGV